MQTITGSFATRREAELAVEHLVQEHGFDRADISVHAAGEANSAGTKAAGADVESGHPDVQKREAPALSDAVEVSVNCKGEHVGTAEAVLREVGAMHTWSR